MKRILLSLFITVLTIGVSAEDGHQLWLRLKPVNKAKVTCSRLSPPIDIARQELETYYQKGDVNLTIDDSMPDDDG